MSRRDILKVIIGVVLGGVYRNIGRKAKAQQLPPGGFSFGTQWSYGPDDGKSLFAWQIIEKCHREEWAD